MKKREMNICVEYSQQACKKRKENKPKDNLRFVSEKKDLQMCACVCMCVSVSVCFGVSQ